MEPETWLHDQVRGLRTYAGVLAGEGLSYSDEVEGCYGVRPKRTPEADVRRQRTSGSTSCFRATALLAERYERWREPQFVPRESMAGAATAIVVELRAT